MRFLPTRIHGIIDYVWSVLLIAAPFVLGFATGGAKQWTAILFGLGGIAYSLLTRYELGLVKVLPFKDHLALDGSQAVILGAAPFVFLDEDSRVAATLVGISLFEATVVLLSKPHRLAGLT